VQKILREIRGMAGVTGVAVIVKRDGHIERLFPAAFTEGHTAELTKLVTSAYQRLRGFERLSLRFQRVVIYLFNRPEYLLFASVLPDCEEDAFETIVKSKMPAIERTLTRMKPKKQAARSGAKANPHAPDQSNLAIEVLLAACTALVHMLGGDVSRNKVAAAWREARDKAALANEELTALEIDAGGKLSVRRGRTLPASVANLRSLAGMAHHFLSGLGTGAPEAEEAFYTLIEPHREMFEANGFYMFMRETSSGTRRSVSRTAR
jgi:hypothetical protein